MPLSRRGLPLGWRLAIITSLIVVAVMGGVTIPARVHDMRLDKAGREELLAESLSPLIVQIERARTLAEVERRIAAFHGAFVERGYEQHHLVLRDASGEVLLRTARGVSEDGSEDALRATVEVTSAALPGGRGAVTVFEDAASWKRAAATRWRSWALHVGVTLFCILLVLHLAIGMLVLRPLDKLLAGVRKMEMGLWDAVEVPRGAWEMRWLGWRFRNMGQELQRTVQRLVAAERRASRVGDDAPRDPRDFEPARTGDAGDGHRTAGPEEPGLADLWARCHQLESMDPESPSAHELATRVWSEEAVFAERFGDMELRARLENAALRLLVPDEFAALERKLVKREKAIQPWIRRRLDELRRALDAERIPYVRLEYRVKHAAGIWRKMETAGLRLEELHDVIGFRIIVPTEPDCYWVLGIVHGVFQPLVGRFRDYIAEPKPSGYQSLHTTLRAADGTLFEVQIRSVAMHVDAERGDAAHVLYKQRQDKPLPPRRRGGLLGLISRRRRE